MTRNAQSLRRQVRYVAALAFLPLVTACEPVPTATPEEAKGPHVTAQVNGAAWNANYAVNAAVGDAYPSLGFTQIVGLEIASDYKGRQITITIAGFDGPGTYTLGTRGESPIDSSWGWYIASPDVRATSQVRSEQDLQYLTGPDGGTVTVTSYNAETGRIAGTFSFEAVNKDDPSDVVSITDGSFQGRIVPGTF